MLHSTRESFVTKSSLLDLDECMKKALAISYDYLR